MVIIERAKFAALVRDYKRALHTVLVLEYVLRQKQIRLTMTLEEICELLKLDQTTVEKYARHGKIRYDEERGMKVYTVTDMLNLRDSIDSQKIYLQTRTGAVPDTSIHIK